METINLFYDSPLGKIRIEGSSVGISGLYFTDDPRLKSTPESVSTSSSEAGMTPEKAESSPENMDENQSANSSETAPENLPKCLLDCKKQIEEYFKGDRLEFDIDLAPEGTDFQQRVWDELLKIPFGEKRSYLYIAEALGDKNSTRAVGNANGKNKVSIIIPCHRVVGSNGKLTGYAGGVWRKEWLLRHEHEMRYGKQGVLGF